MTTRSQIVAEARTWIGTKYRHQGRKKGVAVDCIGLVGGVALACGISGAREWLADKTLHSYARSPDPTLLLDSCVRFMDRAPSYARASAGDVLLFSLQGEPRHFAFVSEVNGAGPTHIIHAYALMVVRGVCEQALPVANARVIAAYSFRGIEG